MPKGSKNKDKVDAWVEGLQDDASFNFESYADCFVSENLTRKYISERKIKLSMEAQRDADAFKKKGVFAYLCG